MKLPSLSRSSGRFFLLISAVAALPIANAQSASDAEVLEPIITTATRTPATPRTIGMAIDYLSAEDLARRQITSLAQALGGVAGSPRFASGEDHHQPAGTVAGPAVELAVALASRISVWQNGPRT